VLRCEKEGSLAFVKEREREREEGKTSGVGKEAQTDGCGVCEKEGSLLFGKGNAERERTLVRVNARQITMGDKRE